MEISRFPCKRLLRMPGSSTTRGRHVSCDIDTNRVAFCGTENISTPNLSFAAQYLAYALPCERFTAALASIPCITRGQCGSLLLHCDGLPPSAFCRSPGAPVHTWPVCASGMSARGRLSGAKRTRFAHSKLSRSCRHKFQKSGMRRIYRRGLTAVKRVFPSPRKRKNFTKSA